MFQLLHVCISPQIDLRHEAKCLEKFYDNFEHIPCVRFPRPVRPFVKRNVLVETFEEGVPISSFLEGSTGDGQYDDLTTDINEKLANIGADALLQMVSRLTHHPNMFSRSKQQ